MSCETAATLYGSASVPEPSGVATGAGSVVEATISLSVRINVKLVVFIQAHVSVHVNVIDHVLFPTHVDIYNFVGEDTVHTGAILSIFVTHALQLHVFHALSFTYHT